MEKTLSIIVPAYNVEEYLNKNLMSILNAGTNDDIEIIVVNDGSKDKTLEIAKEYANQYPDTITVIDKKNGGHGSTINVGAKIAKGRYFRILDGDDWVNTEGFIHYVSYLKSINTDVILCSYSIIEDRTNNVIGQKKAVIEEQTVLKANNYILKLEKFWGIHSLTYKTECYRRMSRQIDENCFYVDQEFNLFPLRYITSMSYCDYDVYRYRVGREGQSVQVKSKIKNREMHKRVIFNLIADYKGNNLLKNIRLFYSRHIAMLCNAQIGIYFYMPYGKMTYKELLDFTREVKSIESNISYFNLSVFVMNIPFSYWILAPIYRLIKH